MQHIARRVDQREIKPPTFWSLLTRSQLGDVFNRYCTGTPVNPMFDSLVTRATSVP
ncbi:hypothetical protein [Planctomicrobium sp. SH664]|uniref:hypothetical protein n=1 Tax=Planctomicrobium sp. SH664 TaxID=3448125 RepID=UPI003F5B906A